MPPLTPRDGDLVVARHPGDGHFEISVSPGPAQLIAAIKNDALRKAFEFAKTTGGSVWVADDQGRFTRATRPTT